MNDMRHLRVQPNVPLVVYYLASVRDSSRPTVMWALNRLGEIAGHGSPFTVPWEQLTPEIVHRLIYTAEQRWAASSVRKMSVIICKVAEIGRRHNVWTQDETTALIAAARNHKRQTWAPRTGRALTIVEVRRLLMAPVSPRDRNILLLAVLFGLRRSELIALNNEDLNVKTRNLCVRGKGQKIRHVPIPDEVVQELADWRGDKPEHLPMFCSIRGGRLAHRTIWQIIDRAARIAGIARFGVHDLRRTAITHMLAAGHDTILVARCVGHSSPQTTAVYDRRGDEITRDVFSKLKNKMEAK